MDKASENQLVEALEKFKGFKIVEGLRGEYYAWRDGLYIWEDGSLNKKATDDKRNCRGLFNLNYFFQVNKILIPVSIKKPFLRCLHCHFFHFIIFLILDHIFLRPCELRPLIDIGQLNHLFNFFL